MACLEIQVHRFFCDNPACPKRTFSERLPEVVAPYARRTQRLAHKQRQVGLAFGGEGGARMLTKLMMPLSGDTLLRLIRAKETEAVETPRVLGVDDWAWCKGHRFSKALHPWIEAVITHKIPKLSAFARGLLKDQAALELPWSNGQVEGQVNRLKLIKRH